MSDSSLQRVDQLLAVHAANALAPLTITKTVDSVFSGIPSMIMHNGLAATAAFLLARANSPTSPDRDAYRRAADALLSNAAEHAGIAIGAESIQTLDNIAAASSRQYQLAEARARTYATWLARLAKARLHREPSDTETAQAERR